MYKEFGSCRHIQGLRGPPLLASPDTGLTIHGTYTLPQSQCPEHPSPGAGPRQPSQLHCRGAVRAPPRSPAHPALTAKGLDVQYSNFSILICLFHQPKIAQGSDRLLRSPNHPRKRELWKGTGKRIEVSNIAYICQDFCICPTCLFLLTA